MIDPGSHARLARLAIGPRIRRDGCPNCNGVVSDGCETDLSSAATCGACGVTCLPRPHADVACRSLACITTCEPDRSDCNGDPEDGCEGDLSRTGETAALAGGAASSDGAATERAASSFERSLLRAVP